MRQFQILQQQSRSIQQNIFKMIGGQQQPSSCVIFQSLNSMISRCYDVNVILIIQSVFSNFNEFLKWFEKCSETELLYSSFVSDTIDRIEQLEQRRIYIFASGNMLDDIEGSICHLETAFYILCSDTNFEDFQEFNKRNENFIGPIKRENQPKNYLQIGQPKIRRVRHPPRIHPISNNHSVFCFQRMMTMLSHNKSKIKKFCALLKVIQPAEKLSNFEKQLMEERQNLQQIAIEKAPCSYIDQHCTIIVLNTLLETSNKCKQLFYRRPYFKDLFILIQEISQQKTNNNKYFDCREKSCNDKSIKYYWNKMQGVIQKIGFLSVCKQITTAEKLEKNLGLKILVDDHQRPEELDYGYANISKYFIPLGGKAILFNPLNTFKIKSVEEIERSASYINNQNNLQETHMGDFEYDNLPRLIEPKNESTLNYQWQTLANQYLKEFRNPITTQRDLFCITTNECNLKSNNYNHGSKIQLIQALQQTNKGEKVDQSRMKNNLQRQSNKSSLHPKYLEAKKYLSQNFSLQIHIKKLCKYRMNTRSSIHSENRLQQQIKIVGKIMQNKSQRSIVGAESSKDDKTVRDKNIYQKLFQIEEQISEENPQCQESKG